MSPETGSVEVPGETDLPAQVNEWVGTVGDIVDLHAETPLTVAGGGHRSPQPNFAGEYVDGAAGLASVHSVVNCSRCQRRIVSVEGARCRRSASLFQTAAVTTFPTGKFVRLTGGGLVLILFRKVNEPTRCHCQRFSPGGAAPASACFSEQEIHFDLNNRRNTGGLPRDMKRTGKSIR